ncbi:type II toxin-antitoxin system Phd/YefM family antitoxin [Salmonella enterica]|nr:type II toxin-antitoxin system Phd/YefM family antitoxin [Salmonella enterica]
MAYKILSSNVISITEFKRNPQKCVKDAGGESLAVLYRNEPAFYVLPPDLYAELVRGYVEHTKNRGG